MCSVKFDFFRNPSEPLIHPDCLASLTQSMTIFSALLDIPPFLRQIQPVLVRGVVAAICCLMAVPAWAAGCHDASGRSTIRAADPFGNPLSDNIVKKYNGGEFTYYVLPDGIPCHGPSCRSLPPVNMTSQPAVVGSDRVDMTFLSGQVCVDESFFAGHYLCWRSVAPCSPVLSGLLRPPAV